MSGFEYCFFLSVTDTVCTLRGETYNDVVKKTLLKDKKEDHKEGIPGQCITTLNSTDVTTNFP